MAGARGEFLGSDGNARHLDANNIGTPCARSQADELDRTEDKLLEQCSAQVSQGLCNLQKPATPAIVVITTEDARDTQRIINAATIKPGQLQGV